LIPQPDGAPTDEMVHLSSFAFVDNGERVLLVKRERPERWAGKWCLPSSLLLLGEDPAVAIRRTLNEQLGVAGTAARLVDVQSYGDKHWDLCFIYRVEMPGVGKLGDDFSTADYFDLSNLPPDLRDDHREVIEMARSRKVI
jgi:ADP-ribose pyrophosphatase YjhB (NUDIX family)